MLTQNEVLFRMERSNYYKYTVECDFNYIYPICAPCSVYCSIITSTFPVIFLLFLTLLRLISNETVSTTFRNVFMVNCNFSPLHWRICVLSDRRFRSDSSAAALSERIVRKKYRFSAQKQWEKERENKKK